MGKDEPQLAGPAKEPGSAGDDQAQGGLGLPVPETEMPPSSPRRAGRSRAGFPVVGIGASAGGLAALEAFFSAQAPGTNYEMAFVIVQHLDPDHKSILIDLVKRYTRLPVYKVEDEMVVKPGCVYVIPPNRDLALLDGKLHLLEPTARHGLRLPIDFFFLSLAQDQREHAVGVILSGTGTDGTLGVKAIKEAGGMVMAQSPESAGYDGMPRSAIATGLVDYALPPDRMLQELSAYVQRALVRKPKLSARPDSSPDAALQKVLLLLRAQSGHDFSGYKQKTIRRRAERRMAVARVDSLGDYVRYLQQSPAELEALFRELLIGVTAFFRDPSAWEALQTQVLPRLFADVAARKLRVWVPACSTGEEAYSLAILMREYLDAAAQSYEVQLFATDIDAAAIDKARAGLFAANIAGDVTPERLARFFTKEDGGYRVIKSIRDMVMFATQNVLRDPPFSRVDLISCRNLLIYLEAPGQKVLLDRLHYALKPGGYLFLGTSESISQPSELYGQLDRKWKIYQGKAKGVYPGVITSDAISPAEVLVTGGASQHSEPPRKMGMREVADRVLAQAYVPASVIINESFEVLYLHGRTARYLEPPVGEPSHNLLRMAREGLRLELAAAVRRASIERKTVRLEGVRVRANGDSVVVNLIVHPADTPEAAGNLLAVIFEEVAPDRKPDAGQNDGTAAAATTDHGQSMAALERELRAKEEYLQTVVEELESVNEELKSTNEELQSTNEELQSSNEALSTSREEMQSINEELTTVNTELQSKIEQLSVANSDISNLLASTNIATLFVDHQLRVQRFTPATSRVISLIHTDVGRPVGDIASRLRGYDRLEADVQEVLDTLILKELVVQHQDGIWYQMRIQPYRTIENVIEGAVLTFVDVTTQTRLQLALQESQERLALVFEVLPVGVSVLNEEGRVVYVNQALERILGFTREELLRGSHTRRPYLRRDGTEMAPEQLANARASAEQQTISHVETGIMRGDGRVVWTDMSVVPVSLPDWKLIMVTFDLSAARGETAASRSAEGDGEKG
jgi:two-component system, chemotaxis family, CheB/CheR fusion protein